MAELTDKLIDWGGLSHFHDRLISDSGITSTSTWSSEKINDELQTLSNTANDDIVSTETVSFTFSDSIPSASGEDGEYVVYRTTVKDRLFEYNSTGETWNEITQPESNILYFDTDGEKLYAYKNEINKFAEVGLANTFTVLNRLDNLTTNAITGAGIYNVILAKPQNIRITRKNGLILSNWLLTVDTTEDTLNNTKIIRQKFENDVTVYKRTYNGSWSTLKLYYEGLVNDEEISISETWSSEKIYNELQTLTKEPNYIVFTSIQDGSTIGLSRIPSNHTLEYSLDEGNTWITGFTTSVTHTLDSGETLYVRGKLSANNTTSYYTQFNITGKISVGGNVNSLWNYENLNAPLKQYCGYQLFKGCGGLFDASDLILGYSDTLLTQSCYSNMFYNCSGLTTAPALPSTTLAEYCYYQMFSNCGSLTTAPQLPATTLAYGCYYYMFQNCTSLTTVHQLPATTLAEYCYEDMFNNCSSLTTLPNNMLPATTLAKYCYSHMFYGCTSLTTAPLLPATTLASACYNYMFEDCSSLTTAPVLPATTLASSCYSYMFYNCTNLSNLPSNMLPATTLANSCYQYMFRNCTSLTAAPELPARTLSNSCYRWMFIGCTSLNYVKCLATSGINENFSTGNWLNGVAGTGTFVKHPDATGWTLNSVDGIPSGWTPSQDAEFEYYTRNQTNTLLNGKQNTLTPGTNIQISGVTITAKGYSYDETNLKCNFATYYRDDDDNGALKLNVASGDYSNFAEGSKTTASSTYGGAHAEGYLTNSIGDYASHSEGAWTTASGAASHSEGLETRALGLGSHAEGYGGSTTDEGRNRAIGDGSHVEGCMTYAQNKAEHAEGSLNVSHKQSNTAGVSGNTLHSIGFGTVQNARKNAEEIMQNADLYIYGIGGYLGTNTKAQDATIKTVQEVINGKQDSLTAGTGITISGSTISSSYEVATNNEIMALFS